MAPPPRPKPILRHPPHALSPTAASYQPAPPPGPPSPAPAAAPCACHSSPPAPAHPAPGPAAAATADAMAAARGLVEACAVEGHLAELRSALFLQSAASVARDAEARIFGNGRLPDAVPPPPPAAAAWGGCSTPATPPGPASDASGATVSTAASHISLPRVFGWARTTPAAVSRSSSTAGRRTASVHGLWPPPSAPPGRVATPPGLSPSAPSGACPCPLLVRSACP